MSFVVILFLLILVSSNIYNVLPKCSNRFAISEEEKNFILFWLLANFGIFYTVCFFLTVDAFIRREGVSDIEKGGTIVPVSDNRGRSGLHQTLSDRDQRRQKNSVKMQKKSRWRRIALSTLPHTHPHHSSRHQAHYHPPGSCLIPSLNHTPSSPRQLSHSFSQPHIIIPQTAVIFLHSTTHHHPPDSCQIPFLNHTILSSRQLP